MISINHVIISSFSSLIGYIVFRKLNGRILLNKIIPTIIFLNELIFISYLIYTDKFRIQQHLPLEMCYINNILIMISLSKNFFHPYFHFSSIFCGLCGILCHNLVSYDPVIYSHFVVSHVILVLYFVFSYQSYLNLTKKEFKISIYYTTILLLIVFFINKLLGSNYWFMFYKPDGPNLTIIFPEWPFYFIVLLVLGFLTYSTVFIVNKNKSRKIV